MRRRRRNRGTWFPILGSLRETEGNSYVETGRTLITNQVNVESGDGPVFDGPEAIVPDFTQESSQNLNAGNTLRDLVAGQDWLLQRIVGKINVDIRSSQTTAQNANQAWQFVKVCVGFFVARADDTDQNTCGLTLQESDPTQVDNAMNPWVWRRTWMLRNPAVSPAGGSTAAQYFNGQYPISNAGYGSVLDGPHIDSKVKRRITREHRLWVVMNAFGWDGVRQATTVGLIQPFATAHMDLRIYGSLRRAKNVSSF